jgi:hypothetical protein
MREILSLGAFAIMLLCFAVFVVSLRPDAIKAGHARSKPEYCGIEHSGTPECGSNVSAGVPGQQR